MGTVNKNEGSEGKKHFVRKKGCRFCVESELEIDYKNKYLLKSFVTERFKIIPRRISGICAKHQRELTLAIKRARHAAILPYSSVQLSYEG